MGNPVLLSRNHIRMNRGSRSRRPSLREPEAEGGRYAARGMRSEMAGMRFSACCLEPAVFSLEGKVRASRGGGGG